MRRRFADLGPEAFVRRARRTSRRSQAQRGRRAHGLIGELLHEIETGERAARQATMREWLESAPAA